MFAVLQVSWREKDKTTKSVCKGMMTAMTVGSNWVRGALRLGEGDG